MEEGQAGGAWGQNTSISILAWPALDSFVLLQVHLLMSSSALPDHQEVNSLCDTGLSPWCSASPQVETKPVDWSLLCCGLRLLRSQREQIFHPQNWREGKTFIPALLSRLKLQAYSLLVQSVHNLRWKAPTWEGAERTLPHWRKETTYTCLILEMLIMLISHCGLKTVIHPVRDLKIARRYRPDFT